MIASKLQIRTRKSSLSAIHMPLLGIWALKAYFLILVFFYFPEVKQIADIDLFTHCCISFLELAADNLKMGQ